MSKQLLTICTITAIVASALGTPKQTTAGTRQAKRRAEVTGPTVYLDYEDQEQRDNSVATFMYFVPMISTVLVESESSYHNTQKVRIVSSQRTSNDKKFEVVCEIEIWGRGYHENYFDAEDIVAKDLDFVPKGKPLKNIIEYIRFEGRARGRVEVKGTKDNGIEQVTSVKVVFNHEGSTSPVTVGLYSMKRKDGKYKFENRYDIMTARVNALSFDASEDDPRMDIQLASLNNRCAKESLYGRIKGKIANLFIEPVRINPEGNRAMLDFGYALYKKQASFTFPKATNLKFRQDEQQKQPVLAKADESDKSASTKTN